MPIVVFVDFSLLSFLKNSGITKSLTIERASLYENLPGRKARFVEGNSFCRTFFDYFNQKGKVGFLLLL
jgi:hypothetical protein